MHINSDLARDVQEIRSHLQALQILLLKLNQTVIRQAARAAASGKLDKDRMAWVMDGAKAAEAEINQVAQNLQVYLSVLEHTLP